MLSVRARDGVFPAYEPYEVTSSVSAAEPEQLREAGSDYPLHVATRYTQLTRDLPLRVKELAVSLTADAETPYDKALAVEAYLKTLPYNLQIEPPPYDADGVDHFLFEQGQGYSEYFASSMAVLLRSVGIPARVAVGYTTGDQVESEPVYAVTDSHSHGWVEVYFPGYDWIPFEPTPGAALPVVMIPGGIAGEELEGPFIAGLDFDCIDEFDLECGVPLEPLPGEGGLPGEFADGGGVPSLGVGDYRCGSHRRIGSGRTVGLPPLPGSGPGTGRGLRTAAGIGRLRRSERRRAANPLPVRPAVEPQAACLPGVRGRHSGFLRPLPLRSKNPVAGRQGEAD